ncbi:MAG TPA: PEGA domain-containing protein, partial [Kofleriaceae bacterium]
MSRDRCGASAFGIALLVAHVVAGHTAEAQSVEAAAEHEFRIGYRALQAGNCSDALVHYRRSLELVQRPRTLFNIATCEEDLGQQAAAWRDYQSFLSFAEERDAAIVVEARARIEALRKRLRGQVFVESNPGGALVNADGERQARGETPVTLSLEPGRHVLRVSMPGAVAVERMVEVAPEDQTSLHVELALSSLISIRTDPADAIIEPRSDGATAIGRFEVSVKPGRHAFVIHRNGYRSEHVEIDALAGRTHDVRVNLRPQPTTSTLVVTGTAGASITIDGKPTSTSLLRELRAGEHEVMIEHGGRVVWRRELQFSPGELVMLDVDLPAPRSSTRRALTWSIGGFGLASVAAGGVIGS